MSLARLIPLGYTNRAMAKKFELILDYAGGYLYWKDINGDVIPVKSNFNDRIDLLLSEDNRLINTGFVGGVNGNYYRGTNATPTNSYVNPEIETEDNLQYMDENTTGIINRLNQQGLLTYTKSENHITSTDDGAAIFMKDARRNSGNGDSDLKIPVMVFPMTRTTEVLHKSFTAGVGNSYKRLSVLLQEMMDETDTKLTTSDFNTTMTSYVPKGLSTYDTVSPYKEYLTMKLIVDAIINRYTKTETDTNFLGKGSTPANTSTFNTDNKYIGYRNAKDIADVVISIINNINDNYMKKASTEDLNAFNSTVPYTNYTTIKSIIDALIPKGAGWNASAAPYSTYTTMKVIVDTIENIINTRYTKTETDSTFMKQVNTIPKGATAAEINTYNTVAPYTSYTTLKNVIDAIENLITTRYTKTQSDELYALALPRATDNLNLLLFNGATAYDNLRTAKQIVDKLLDTISTRYTKTEVDTLLNGKLNRGGTLPPGYDNALLLVNRIKELEASLLSVSCPIKFDLVGTCYGEVWDIAPPHMGNISNMLMVPSIISTETRRRNWFAPMIAFDVTQGNYGWESTGVVADITAYNTSNDLDRGTDSYAIAGTFSATSYNQSTSNDLVGWGSNSHSAPHADDYDFLQGGNSRSLTKFMANKCSKIQYVITNDSDMKVDLWQISVGGSMAVKLNDFANHDTFVPSGDTKYRKKQIHRQPDFGFTPAPNSARFIQTLRTGKELMVFRFRRRDTIPTSTFKLSVPYREDGGSVSSTITIAPSSSYGAWFKLYDTEFGTYHIPPVGSTITYANGDATTATFTITASNYDTKLSYVSFNNTRSSAIEVSEVLSTATVTIPATSAGIHTINIDNTGHYSVGQSSTMTITCYNADGSLYTNGAVSISTNADFTFDDISVSATGTRTTNANGQIIGTYQCLNSQGGADYASPSSISFTSRTSLVDPSLIRRITLPTVNGEYSLKYTETFQYTASSYYNIDIHNNVSNAKIMTLTTFDCAAEWYTSSQSVDTSVALETIYPGFGTKFELVYFKNLVDTVSSRIFELYFYDIGNGNICRLRYTHDFAGAVAPPILQSAKIVGNVTGGLNTELAFSHLEKKIDGNIYIIPDTVKNPFTHMHDPHRVFRVSDYT